jgi:hypothetical protein
VWLFTGAGHGVTCACANLAHCPHSFLVGARIEAGIADEACAPFCIDQALRACHRLLGRIRADLHQQPTCALRHQSDVVRQKPLPGEILDDRRVEAFESDRFVLHDERGAIAGDEYILVAQHDERPDRRAVDQLGLRLQYHDAGALTPDQGASHVESVLWQEFIEVVPDTRRRILGNSARTRS